MKKCTQCSTEKDEKEFYSGTNGKPRAQCKECCIARSAKWANENRDIKLETVRKWKHKNRDKVNASASRRRQENPEKYRKANKEYNAKYAERRKRWVAENREKVRATKSDWARRNPDKARFYAIKSKYGMSIDEYTKLLEKQGGVCAICKKQKPLRVDHNHATGKHRGLLCHGCNVAMGFVGEDRQTLENMIQYIDTWRTI